MRLAKPIIVALVVAGIAAVASFGDGLSVGGNYTDPEQLASLVSGQGEPYFLVDVRTEKEYLSGHIPTAVNIPYDTIAAQPPTKDISALIIVYCGSGVRSARAAVALAGIGYTRVVDFGPVSRWEGDLVEPSPEGPSPTG